jgi:hypothetical protein
MRQECGALAAAPLQVFSAPMLAYGPDDMIVMFWAAARIDRRVDPVAPAQTLDS